MTKEDKLEEEICECGHRRSSHSAYQGRCCKSFKEEHSRGHKYCNCKKFKLKEIK